MHPLTRLLCETLLLAAAAIGTIGILSGCATEDAPGPKPVLTPPPYGAGLEVMVPPVDACEALAPTAARCCPSALGCVAPDPTCAPPPGHCVEYACRLADGSTVGAGQCTLGG